MKNNGNKTESRNVYQMVTDRVIEQMRQGIIPWQRPWTGGGGCVNYVSRKPYSHLNQLLLGRPGEWLTFKQVQDCGGHIKKGAKAAFVVFYAQRVVSKTKHIKDEETGKERDEFMEEGMAMAHCVFKCEYYKKPYSLILSARIGDKRIETIEVDLTHYTIKQCYGKHDQFTMYHQRILDLVNAQMDIIKAFNRNRRSTKTKIAV